MSTAIRALVPSRPPHGLTAILQILGWASLALVVAGSVLFPVTGVHLALAVVATIGISTDRRFGPLPAALLVILAVPYDRAANIFLPRVF